MIPKGCFGISIYAEAIVWIVIGTRYTFSVPDTATLDAEMVVGFSGEVAVAVAGF
jgi:ABC-type amino acid transport substrate-binding protein